MLCTDRHQVRAHVIAEAFSHKPAHVIAESSNPRPSSSFLSEILGSLVHRARSHPHHVHDRQLTPAHAMAMSTASKMALGSKVSLKPAPASTGLVQTARPLRCGAGWGRRCVWFDFDCCIRIDAWEVLARPAASRAGQE